MQVCTPPRRRSDAEGSVGSGSCGSLALSTSPERKCMYVSDDTASPSDSTTSQTYYSTDEATSTGSHPLGGCDIVNSYMTRRNKRLEALKAGRTERNNSLPPVVDPQFVCMDEHPYYAIQRNEKLQGLQQPFLSHPEALTEAPLGIHAPNAQNTLRDELVAAHKLIHRQRVRIQQLEKAEDVPKPRFEDPHPVISQLQNQLIHLHHERALGEFQLRNRITDDAMSYRDLLTVWKKEAHDWQSRFQSAWEDHELQSEVAGHRIQMLEEEVAQRKGVRARLVPRLKDRINKTTPNTPPQARLVKKAMGRRLFSLASGLGGEQDKSTQDVLLKAAVKRKPPRFSLQNLVVATEDSKPEARNLLGN
jgi:hypothetical protein